MLPIFLDVHQPFQERVLHCKALLLPLRYGHNMLQVLLQHSNFQGHRLLPQLSPGHASCALHSRGDRGTHQKLHTTCCAMRQEITSCMHAVIPPAPTEANLQRSAPGPERNWWTIPEAALRMLCLRIPHQATHQDRKACHDTRHHPPTATTSDFQLIGTPIDVEYPGAVRFRTTSTAEPQELPCDSPHSAVG